MEGDSLGPVHLTLAPYLAAQDEARGLEGLSIEERAQYHRFIPADARRQYLAAHCLLRTELGARLGQAPTNLQLLKSAYGQPYLADRALSFSLTHTRGLVACAVGGGRLKIGVDAEALRSDLDLDLLAPRVLGPQEQHSWLLLDNDMQTITFLALWVLKEACAKAIGLGLSAELRQIQFALPLAPTPGLHWPDQEAAWLSAPCTSQLPVARPADPIRLLSDPPGATPGRSWGFGLLASPEHVIGWAVGFPAGQGPDISPTLAMKGSRP